MSYDYTKYKRYSQKVQFQPLLDLVFLFGDQLLPANALIDYLKHVINIVLNLYNQKNLIIGESISKFLSESEEDCPVRADFNNSKFIYHSFK